MATAGAGWRGRGGQRRRRWPRRVFVGVAIALGAAAVLGFVVAPPVIRHVAERQLGAWLGRRVTIARVRVNPLALAVTVEGLRVYEPDGRTPFAGFARLRVDVEARSLTRRGLVVRELRLESPRARIVRERGDAADPLAGYNVSDIVARLRGPPGRAAPEQRSAPPRFSLSNIQIVDGAVRYEDRQTSTRHDVSDLSLGVPFVSTLPADAGVFVAPRLSFRIDGTPLVVAARGRPSAGVRDATAHAHVSALDLTRWLPLVPVRLPVVVTSGALDADVDVAFAPRPGAAPTLTLRGRVALDRLAAETRAGASLGRVEEVEVRIREIDVAAARFAFDRVTVARLDTRVRRLRDGTLDWQRLLAGPGTSPPRGRRRRGGAGERAPRFEINELAVKHATVRLRDETARPPFEVVVAPLELWARDVSTAPGSRARVTLDLRATPGGTLHHEGTLSLAPLAATGDLTVDVPRVGAFAPYIHERLAVDVASGRVRLSGRYRLDRPRAGPRLVLSRVSLDLVDLVVGPRGAARSHPSLRVPRLRMRDTTIDLGARTVSVGPIESRGGWISVMRAADGKLRLAALLPPRAEAPAPPRRAARWDLTLMGIDLEGWNGRYEDRDVRPPVDVSVSSVSLRARDFHVSPELRGHAELALDVGARGHVALGGTATIKPLALDFHAAVTTAPIAPFQGYFVKYEGATIADGVVSAEGRLVLSVHPRTDGPGRDVKLDVTGDAALENVVARDAREGKDLVRWRALRIGGVALSLMPVRLAIRDVTLVEPWARFVRHADGRSNLGPFGDPDRDEEKAAKAGRGARRAWPRPEISIGRVAIQGGRVAFYDRAVRPPFAGQADAIDAQVTGLSTGGRSRGDVRVRARLEGAAPLVVSGTLNPLADKLVLDMKLALHNLDVPFTNPYAARYVGYLFEKGKLDLDVTCRAQNGRLDAQSRIVLDQLQLGPRVESPRAIKAPVALAVRVLRDRGGRIEIEVPVSGRLGDPSFSFTAAIERAFSNVLRRVVTAPFALVAGLFRGDRAGRLSEIEFAPGTATLDAAATGTMQALADALRLRDDVSFAIEGTADPKRDGAGARAGSLDPLARRRASVVRDALARAAPGAAGRLFLLKPDVKEGAGSRVKLRLEKR